MRRCARDWAAGLLPSTPRWPASGSRIRTRRESSTTGATSPTSIMLAPSTTGSRDLPRRGAEFVAGTRGRVRRAGTLRRPARALRAHPANRQLERHVRMHGGPPAGRPAHGDRDQTLVLVDLESRRPAGPGRSADRRPCIRGNRPRSVSTSALDELERILERVEEPDDALRAAVAALADEACVSWAGIAFLDQGPSCSARQPASPTTRSAREYRSSSRARGR